MAYRPAQIYTGSGWDDIGDPRVVTVQTDVTNLQNDVAKKIDYATPVNAQNGSGATAYTFALADGLRLTSATNAAAKTFIIPPQTSVTWPNNTIIRVVNYGAGALTVAGGSGVTVTNAAKTLAQYESASLIRTGSNAWTLVPFGGSGALPPSSVQYLVIAGGGGGGNFVGGVSNGGGGGAGGYRCSVSGESSGQLSAAESPMSVTAGVSYSITVGGGGAAQTAGSSSSISGTGLSTITSTGGGLGSGSSAGGSGGSGGGGNSASDGGAGTAGQGFNGAGNVGGFRGGGGGGAGGNPSDQVGGAGISSSISGSSVARGGGGGGGGSGTSTGGSGGGGTGGSSGGTANTGGGGGGGFGAGGLSGGSGVVIIRHPDAFKTATTTGSPLINNVSGQIVYIFNASGTIEWAA